MITIPHKILLIRHAESENNAAKRCNTPETPLTHNAHLQVHEIIEDIKKIGDFQEIHCSELLRARQTAEILANSLNISKMFHVKHFNERNGGFLHGMLHDEVKSNHPQFWDFEHERFNLAKPAGGEGFDEIMLRTNQAIDYINTLTQNTIIVSHGTFMRVLLAKLNGITKYDELMIQKVKNCQIFRLN